MQDNRRSSLRLDATQKEAPKPEPEENAETDQDSGQEENADLSVVEPEARRTALFFDRFAETKISDKRLPHWKQDGKLYFVTWRQADSIPRKKRDQLKRERAAWFEYHGGIQLKDLPLGTRMEYYRLFDARVQQWLDAGYGSCVLKHPGPRQIMIDALHHFNNTRYRLGSFAIAGNHVHVLVAPDPGIELTAITHSWKSFTANAINKRLSRSGHLWQFESYDHLVRNAEELERIEKYILDHVDQGGLVEQRTLDTER